MTVPVTSAAAAPSSAGAASPAAAEVARAIEEPVRVRLDELGVIAARGADAASFLQGQLTNDVLALGADRVVLSGYCTPKGRLLATLRCWRDGEAVYLQLPREILPGVLKRLSMYVLRAKATLADDSASWSCQAVLGAGAEAWLRERFGALPQAPGQCVRVGAGRLLRLPAAPRLPERFVVLGPARDGDVAPALSSLPETGAAAFWWSEIDAALPTVFAATQEKYVPQMINFEVVGGVSFSKGCYPGQEVVARSQFRGKMRRRMQRGHSAAGAAPGADVFVAGAREAVGTVVMSAPAPAGGTDLLFECPVEHFGDALHLRAPDGPPLRNDGLPYEIVDVTA